MRLAMGDADWDALAKAPNPNNERLPRRDIAVKDGDTITVGSTTIKLHVLGGHTPGDARRRFHGLRRRKAVPRVHVRRRRTRSGPSGCRTVPWPA